MSDSRSHALEEAHKHTLAVLEALRGINDYAHGFYAQIVKQAGLAPDGLKRLQTLLSDLLNAVAAMEPTHVETFEMLTEARQGQPTLERLNVVDATVHGIVLQLAERVRWLIQQAAMPGADESEPLTVDQITEETLPRCWRSLEHFHMAHADYQWLQLELDKEYQAVEALTKPPAGDDGDPPKMSREDAAQRLERLRQQGEKFTSRADMAERFGCSSSTVQKAIENTPSLQAWAKPKQAAPRAQSLDAVVLDNTEQDREADPTSVLTDDEVDIIQRKLIEEAPAEQRGYIQQQLAEKTPDEIKKFLSVYANRDDWGDTIQGRTA